MVSAEPPAGGSSSPTIFLSAGETSGDRYGARLAHALRRRLPDVRLLGTGGEKMASAGVRLLAELDDLAVLGVAEVATSVPFFLRLRRQVRRCLVREGVDLVVPIDYPGFNLPLARFASRRGIPVLYYIAPQVWAWHRARVRALTKYTRRLCVVLPFEEDLFRAEGAQVEFVGHPLLDESRHSPGGESARSKRRETVVGVFPGSRAQEVERLLGPFLGAVRKLAAREPNLRVAVARSPHLDSKRYPGVPSRELISPEKAASVADVAITKSGTMTLELALHRTPMVVAYRMHPITFSLARRLVRVDHVALVNLIAGRRLVPELLQDDVVPERLARAAAPLLEASSPDRRRMVEGLEEVAGCLGNAGVAGRVAEHCVALLGEETS